MSWRTSLTQPIYAVFGANTGVGKTIVSTLLVKSFAPQVTYIKPVSTGPLSEADYLHVDKFSGVAGKVLYQFETPCSPHLAAGPDPPSDSAILRKLSQELDASRETPIFIESAGGVHSPTPSGTSQMDLYRPLRFPVILVADSNLGGISTTISAYESLRLHGFDVAAIVGFRASWGNMPYLASKIPVPAIQIPAPPPRQENPEEDAENLSVYYDLIAASPAMKALKLELQDAHQARIQRLEEMPEKALEKLWYPFTQHSHLSPSTITTIDSALNDDFAVFDSEKTSLKPVFDASASWWTQGLGHGNSELALEAAYAASRYGHVILPSAVNEPALALAETLLTTAGKGWASRVYYSDNGATGIEVALKMALKASRVRYGKDKEALKLGIIGYTGSYHGDTIGAMDASDPNVYNEEVDWYQARGLFFDPPSLIMTQGRWRLQVPPQSESAQVTEQQFDDLSEIFDLQARMQSSTAELYRSWINKRLNAAVDRGQKFGALMFEPILLGAGGMVFVDPLFQRLLVDIVRTSTNLCPPAATAEVDAWTGLPVITDEVFTGLYRLSVPRAFELLGIHPDISVNAKLLTGGAVPLATTMATENIFNVFLQEDKKDALLHGHSYTAHPVGTSVAIKSLLCLNEIYTATPKENQTEAQSIVSGCRKDWKSESLFSIWSNSFVTTLSNHEALSGVICLGSVLAVTLKTSDAGGYTSLASTKFLKALRLGDGETSILARPLGNVVYFMASQVTRPETARRVETLILEALK